MFGLTSDCLFSILVGIVGSRRRIGFGWSFLLSLLFTPLVGLIIALISSPLPVGDRRWGCLGVVIAILALISLGIFLFLLFAGTAVLTL